MEDTNPNTTRYEKDQCILTNCNNEHECSPEVTPKKDSVGFPASYKDI